MHSAATGNILAQTEDVLEAYCDETCQKATKPCQLKCAHQNDTHFSPVTILGTQFTPIYTGKTIAGPPIKMETPQQGTQTSASQIEVTWEALKYVEQTGGDHIISYDLEWD